MRGGGALAGEENESERGLTVPYRVLGRVFRNGGARAELGEELIAEWRTHGGGTAEAELGLQWRRRRSARAERGQESERARAEGREWERGRRRAQPSSSGGRPGRVLAVACSPRGGRTLPARHGGTERPSARGRGRERGAGEGEGTGGPGRLRPAGQK